MYTVWFSSPENGAKERTYRVCRASPGGLSPNSLWDNRPKEQEAWGSSWKTRSRQERAQEPWEAGQGDRLGSEPSCCTTPGITIHSDGSVRMGLFCERRLEVVWGWSLSLSPGVLGWDAGLVGCGDTTLHAPHGSVPMTLMLSAPAQSLPACLACTTAW